MVSINRHNTYTTQTQNPDTQISQLEATQTLNTLGMAFSEIESAQNLGINLTTLSKELEKALGYEDGIPYSHQGTPILGKHTPQEKETAKNIALHKTINIQKQQINQDIKNQAAYDHWN